ncbi:MAG: substrate-binding domain-containing protein [Leptolinea sp.]
MKTKLTVLSFLVISAMLLSACAPQTAPVAPVVPVEKPAEKPVAQEPTAVQAAPTTAPAEKPAVSEEIDFAKMGIDCAKYSDTYSKGPNGEVTTAASKIKLTDEDIAKVKQGNYTAALLWAGAGEWYNGLTSGAKAEFEKLGIKIVATGDAQFDPAKQATDVETALALKPNIILTLVVDPVSGAQAFQPAVDKNVVLVFADNGADKYEAGKQYVGIVTGDHYGMGRGSADLMAEAIGGKGKIGFIYHDADYFVTNNRDRSFICQIKSKYPDIKVVAAGGFTEEPKTEEVASAMLTQHSDLNGIYVAWDVAAEGVIAALRGANRTDIKVITEDLGANNDLDMAQGGNMYGKTIDMPYSIGVTMADQAALKLLGKETYPFVVVDLMKVKKDNLADAWKKALNLDPPENIMKALEK